MDTQLIVSILGPAFWEVAKTLLEKGRDIALDKGLQPIKDWVNDGYDERKDGEKLREALLKTLDQLKVEGQYDSLIASLKFTGLENKTQLALAGAAVEMTRFAPEAIPIELLTLLDLDVSKREMVARFLFLLRNQLKSIERYKALIQCANDIDSLGQLRGLTNQMLVVADRLATLVSYEQALISERHLSIDDASALRDYLVEMRQKWEGLMLPLLRKKSGDITSAKLKQVFVPLRLRDVRAEDEARRKSNWLAANTKDLLQGLEDEIKPIEIGDLLNRYPKFMLLGVPGSGKTTLLNRMALAFAEGRAQDDLGWKGKNLFPIFIRLRNFGVFLKQNKGEFSSPSSGAIIAYLENSSRDGDRIHLTTNFFDRRLAEGNCLVLMDGLDEVSDLRSEVAGHVDAFVARFAPRGNYVGMASRPRGYESVERQLRPVGLAVAEVNPLDLAGISQLMENLLILIEPDKFQRETDLEELVAAIGSSDELTRIAGTPLFCSTLVQVFKYHGAQLPNRRIDVFDEIVDLLLGHWHAQQTRYLSDADQLAMEDGTGKSYGEVKKAVAIKRMRLSKLALHMQETHQAEISATEAEDYLTEYLTNRERGVPDEDTARNWAENFLINSHEQSGLLVERDPGVYTFLHKGFMEYLAATALAAQSKTLVDMILPLIADKKKFDWWEQVILLAGAHPGTPEDVREELISRLLEIGKTYPVASEDCARYLTFAGDLARDMGDDLPAFQYKLVQSALFEIAVNTTVPPMLRSAAADSLDQIGFIVSDLSIFISFPNFSIAKYPVTNSQYERFLKSDFGNQKYWMNFPKFDKDARPTDERWVPVGWEWLQKALKGDDYDVQEGVLLPRYWRDPRFGISRRHAPVVGISWHEASAYCEWLLENWDQLDEGKRGLPKPQLARLPTEDEWVFAAGGEYPEERYAWDKHGNKTGNDKVLCFANTRESRINRTTPVWMYPEGKSPSDVMDLSGNVVEWQANYSSPLNRYLALRGGTWSYNEDVARISFRGYNLPDLRADHVGFRVVILPRG